MLFGRGAERACTVVCCVFRPPRANIATWNAEREKKKECSAYLSLGESVQGIERDTLVDFLFSRPAIVQHR